MKNCCKAYWFMRWPNYISQHSLWQLNKDKIKHQCAFVPAHLVLKVFLSFSGNFVDYFMMKTCYICLFWPQSLDLFRTLRNHPEWLVGCICGPDLIFNMIMNCLLTQEVSVLFTWCLWEDKSKINNTNRQVQNKVVL